MTKRLLALLAVLLLQFTAYAGVGVDAFVADEDEKYIPIPTAYEV